MTDHDALPTGVRELLEKLRALEVLDDTLLVIDGEHFGTARSMALGTPAGAGGDGAVFPRAFLDGEEVPVRRASDTQLGVVVDASRLRTGGNTLQIALDPYAVLRMNLKP